MDVDIAQKINTLIDYRVILSLLNYDEKDKRHNLLTVIDNKHSASEAKAKKIYLEPSFDKDGEVISMWHGTNFSSSEEKFGVVLHPLDFYICEKYYSDLTWSEYKKLDKQEAKESYNKALTDLSKFIEGNAIDEIKSILDKAKKEKYNKGLTRDERHAFLMTKLSSSLIRDENNSIINEEAYKYLVYTRHIPNVIVDRMISDNFFYQGKLENTNIVEVLFVGKYEDGKFASVEHRSCNKNFKMNGTWKNSDKKIGYPFFPDAKLPLRNEPDSSKPLICFEAPIDMLSFMGILHLNGIDWTNYNYVATGGCGNSNPIMRLSELYGFKNVGISYDNDKEGIKGMEILHDILAEKSIASTRYIPDAIYYNQKGKSFPVKDWNDRLCLYDKEQITFSEEEVNSILNFLENVSRDSNLVVDKVSDINTNNKEMEEQIMAQKETVKMKGNIGREPNVSADGRYAYLNVAIHNKETDSSTWMRLYAKEPEQVELIKKSKKGDFIEFEGTYQKQSVSSYNGKEYSMPQYKISSLKNFTLSKNERENSTVKFCGNMVKDIEIKEGEKYKYFDVAVHEKENSNEVTYYHCYSNNGTVLDMLGQSLKGDLVQLEGVPKESKGKDGSIRKQFDVSSFRVVYRKQENQIDNQMSEMSQEMEEFPTEDADDMCQE